MVFLDFFTFGEMWDSWFRQIFNHFTNANHFRYRFHETTNEFTFEYLFAGLNSTIMCYCISFYCNIEQRQSQIEDKLSGLKQIPGKSNKIHYFTRRGKFCVWHCICQKEEKTSLKEQMNLWRRKRSRNKVTVSGLYNFFHSRRYTLSKLFISFVVLLM